MEFQTDLHRLPRWAAAANQRMNATCGPLSELAQLTESGISIHHEVDLS